MGLVLEFTDKWENVYESSYWHIVHMQVDPKRKEASIVIAGHKNKAAKDAGKPEVGRQNCHILEDQSDIFDQYFAPSVVDVSGKNHISQAYEYLKDNVEFFSEASDL